MNAVEMSKLVDHQALMTTGISSVRVLVKIVDAQMAYGRVRVQVEPVAGFGSAWVDLERCDLV